ncbi:MAG: type VII secretion-associated protein [Actinophytocola sp.]|nr:type VII secretion-associated protein [Actinophytocola sp.]
MTLRVAVDFGTSSTCVVAAVNDLQPQVVVIDGHPLLPSAVYAAPDGTLFVGQEAERQAAVDPSRYEPHPKRRIDEGELLLGSTVLSVRDVVQAVLRRALAEARRFAGGAEVDLLVLTHPADWGVMRTRSLRQAAAGLARDVALVPEPVAAAVFHSRSERPRQAEHGGGAPEVLAVLDVGGGTVDVSVVGQDNGAGAPGMTHRGFRVLATKGDPSFGGADIDQALLEHVGSMVPEADRAAWRNLMEGRELADRRRRRVLRQDVRGAKETLSRHTYTDVPMPPPFADAHVTRHDLERLIADPLGRAVALTSLAIEEGGLRPSQLTGVFLVGGSSRIPMIARLVHERIGIVPTTLDQPETVVARGAMRAVLAAQGGQRARPVSAPVPAPQGVAPAGRPPPPPRHPAAIGSGPTQRIAAPAGMPPNAAQPGVTARLPSPKRAKRLLPWLAAGSVLVVAGAVVLVVMLTRGPDVAAFSYEFDHPSDWEQTDVNQDFRRVVVRPSDARDGSDLISVQDFTLGYDFESNRERFLRELRTRLDESETSFSAVDPDLEFGGRPVIHYSEPDENSPVDWFVFAENNVQISVGCRWTPEGKARLKAACEEVVRTMKISG